jgi:hypothetical protein
MLYTIQPSLFPHAGPGEAALARASSVQQALERNGQAISLLVDAVRSAFAALGQARVQWALGGRG